MRPTTAAANPRTPQVQSMAAAAAAPEQQQLDMGGGSPSPIAPHGGQQQQIYVPPGAGTGDMAASGMTAMEVQNTLVEAAKTKVELTQIAASMEEKVSALQKTVSLEDRERMDKIQRDLTSSVQRNRWPVGRVLV